MSARDDHNIGYTDGDLDTNTSSNATFQSIVEARYSRRNILRTGFSATALAVFGALPLAACGDDDDQPADGLPSAGAGSSITTTAGRTVTLSGTASDDKGVASVAWTQVSGPAVTLAAANTNTATFVAPGVAANTPLVFRFTVTDSKGQSVASETTVTVGVGQLGFTAVAKSLADVVSVPAGYTVSVLYRLGDPIAANVPAYANNGTDSNFAQRAGDHHDGMTYFGLAASGTARDDASNVRGLLAMNHENITQVYLHANGPTAGANRVEAEAQKEMDAHGVSVVEIARGATGWGYVQTSSLNRRITPATPMTFRGPAAGSALLRTAFSPTGVSGRGTINNCANGTTPWGTYLTCEENWAGYFRRPPLTDNVNRTAKEVASLARYGVTSSTGSFSWSTVVAADAANTLFSRWNAVANPAAAADGTGDFRNEPNQFGWVVEIDPYDPASTPRKRTALGRMGHECCAFSLRKVGSKIAVYMGDDSRGEYLYKFVSNAVWAAADATAADRLAMGDKYLDAGVLYVAKFAADGSGQWMPLVFGQGAVTASNPAYAFADQADVLVNTRLAADAQGATKMDRPEWTAVNPANGEVYLTLTNNDNTNRPVTGTDAANPRSYNDPKGAAAQRGNPNGHIIRLREAGDAADAVTFRWDIYAFGAGADLDAANINISGLDATNDFSSPDGAFFSRPTNAAGVGNPVLWIQTDDGAYTDVTNCMMLAATPGVVGDGGTKTITNTDGVNTRTQATIVGKAPGAALRRFLVGPKDCEITGIDTTPDGRAVFVNIQHPGETGSIAAPTSSWPANQTNASATGRPRSSTIVITKDDGGVVGL